MGRLACAAALLLALAPLCAAQYISDFTGTWLFRYQGLNIMKLTLTAAANGTLSGSLVKPGTLTIDQDGDVTELGPGQGQVVLSVQQSKLAAGRLELVIDGDPFVMVLKPRDRATLAIGGMRPWEMERVAGGSTLSLATSLPEPHYTDEIRALRDQLRVMVKEDQDARKAFDNTRTNAADDRNRTEVLRIFKKYGWVTISLAGKDASHNYWLLVQHQTPEIQRQILPALEKAAKAGDAPMSDYAYLYDRVQVGLGKPQHWGSQTRCVDGKPVLDPVDDPAGLDARRKELFMPPIQDYLKMDYLTKFCESLRK